MATDSLLIPKTTKGGKVRVVIYLPLDVKEALSARAAASGEPATKIAEDILRQSLISG